MNRTLLALAVTAALAAAGATPASATPFTNGSFETGDFTGWTLTHGTGSTNTAGIASALDFVYPSIGGSYVAQDGSDFAMLGDNIGSGATLSQTFTDLKTTEMVTFYLASDGYTPNAFSVTWDGALITASAITNFASQSYVRFDYLVNTTGSDTLLFTAEDTDGFLSLDDVSVPEPSTLALFGAGTALISFGMLRRKRTGRAA